MQIVAAARFVEEFLGRRSMHVVLVGDFSACARIFDEPVDGVWASDHFGVVADLALPARSPGF